MQPFYSLIVLPTPEGRIWESSTIIADMSISPLNSIIFASCTLKTYYLVHTYFRLLYFFLIDYFIIT